MRDTLRNKVILEKLKSLQNDIINEQFDIKDFIVELGGDGLKVRELYQEFSNLSDDFEIITSLIETREGF
tara:strand:+ start:278 stop:487 length:210 start_codon:yes stop_codon:yes gene_type:complete